MNTLDYGKPAQLSWRQILRRPIRVAGFVVLAVVIFFVGILISDHRKREREYQRALIHLPLAQAAITGDARFSRVRIDAINGKHGVSLWVSGAISNTRDYAALDQAIRATRPSVMVHFSVGVRP